MYVVKLKYQDSLDACYANSVQTHPIKEIRDEDSNFHLLHFLLSLKDAKELMLDIILKNNSDNETYFDNTQKLEYISIVEVSTYEPYREWQVISYKGFD